MSYLEQFLIGVLVLGSLIGVMYYFIRDVTESQIREMKKRGCTCDFDFLAIPTVDRECPIHGGWLDD